MALRKTNISDATVTTLIPANGTKVVRAGINEENISHIIGRLTELYADPRAAALRETVSNATDATVALPPEQRRPIEIELPTLFDRTLRIRDHGVGMSPETVENTYSNYGASTKGSDLKAVGSHGLGGKSPLAYTDHFTAVTVKDGVKTRFTMSRSNGEVETSIRSEKTTDSNGTEVSIPVRSGDEDKFDALVESYRRHSRIDPKLIDDELFTGDDSYFKLGEMVIYKDQDEEIFGAVYMHRRWIRDLFNNHANGFYNASSIGLNMAGWVYDLEGDSSLAFDNDVIVEIVPGVVNFDSSRDAVTNDDKLRVLANRIDNFLSAKETFEKAFEIVRQLDRVELRRFMRSNGKYFGVSEDEVIFRTKVFPLSVFDSELGFNPLRVSDRSLDPGKPVFSMSIQAVDTNYGYSRWSAESSSYKYKKVRTAGGREIVDSSTLNQLRALQELYKDTGTPFSATSVAEDLYGEETSVTYITDVDKDAFSKIMRHRKHLFKKKGDMLVFTSADRKSLDADDVKLAETILGSENFSVTSYKALMEEIKPLIEAASTEKKAAVKRRDKLVLEETRSFHRLSTAENVEPAEALKGSLYRDNRSFQAAFDAGAVVIFSGVYDWRYVYIGAVNSGLDLTNTEVLIYSDKLNATDAAQLEPYRDRLLFKRYFNANSVAAKKLIKDREFYGVSLDAVLRSMSFDNLVLNLWGTPYRFNTEMLPSVRPFMNESKELSRLLDIVLKPDARSTVTCSDEEATSELKRRFGVKYTTALSDLKLAINKLWNSGEFSDRTASSYLALSSPPEDLDSPILQATLAHIAAALTK